VLAQRRFGGRHLARRAFVVVVVAVRVPALEKSRSV